MDNVLGTLFGDIASAIREKTGDTATMKPAEFPDKIAGIETGGGSGGGSLPAGLYMEPLAIPPARSSGYGQTWYEWNGTLYAFVNETTGSSGINRVYRLDGSAWTQVHQASSSTHITGGNARIIEFGGILHIFDDGSIYHATFDGTTLVRKTDMAKSFAANSLFTHNGKLKGCYSGYDIYVWNESTDTWSLEVSLGNYLPKGFYEVDGVAYVPANTALYTYDGKSLTLVATDVNVGTEWIVGGGRVYCLTKQGSYLYYLNEVDMSTYQTVTLGFLPLYNGKLLEYDSGLAITNNNIAANGYAAWMSKVHEVKEG